MIKNGNVLLQVNFENRLTETTMVLSWLNASELRNYNKTHKSREISKIFKI